MTVRIFAVAATGLVCLAMLLADACGDHGGGGAIRIDLSTAGRVADVGDQLVSVGVDLDQVTGGTFWDPAGGSSVVPVAPYDFERPQLRQLAAELAPAHLRIGGSASDRTFYDLGDSPAPAPPSPYVTQLTRAEWDAIGRFATDLGFNVILTINAGPGPRLPDGTWTDANARELLTYIAARSTPVSVLEFGNEPNLFGLRAGLSGYDASAYARDLASMRALRDSVLPKTRLAVPGNIFTRTLGEDLVPGVILGPTTADMLAFVGPTVDIVTYHYYAAISTRCPTGPRVDEESALEASYLSGITVPIAMVTALRDQYAGGRPVWMMESGGQSCGGQIGVADRFVNSFWYLETLGRMARAGEEAFVRWTLSGSTYGLIDDATLEPRPDYWAAVLWRRLMGGVVLAPVTSVADPDLRVFAHCTRNGENGAVTLLALNSSQTRTIGLDLPGHHADLYLVTASDPASAEIRLNGASLITAAHGRLPDLTPVASRNVIALPPVSYAFVVIHDGGNPVCNSRPGE